jgi:Skp family chaperone for outer membrane proteins
VAIKSNGKKSFVTLNRRVTDDNTGEALIENNISQVRSKVVLSDIPTTASFKAQQLSILSEVAKSLPAAMQAVFVPAMILLTDAPDKENIAEEIRKMAGLGPKLDDEEQALADKQAGKEKAEASALQRRAEEAKVRELEAKVEKLIKEGSKIDAEKTNKLMEAIYASLQAGQIAVTIPNVAPVADEMLASADFPEAEVAGLPAMQQIPPQEAVVTPKPAPISAEAKPLSPFAGENMGIETMRNDGDDRINSPDLGEQDHNNLA